MQPPQPWKRGNKCSKLLQEHNRQDGLKREGERGERERGRKREREREREGERETERG